MKKKITTVSLIHYFRLFYRSLLFLVLLFWYISYRWHYGQDLGSSMEKRPVILIVMWAVFAFEMIMRFFPSRYESPGCQKQFACNYKKTGKTEIIIHDNNATMMVAMLWIVCNGFFGMLYMKGIFDEGIMLLLCSAYSVCDLICILFFCPFQSWFLKNKCCSTCRIYNWDYARMFTPLFFIKKSYTWSLLLLAVALLVRWEITFYRHPERFSENTNEYLNCKNCTEKLCAHKKQLKYLWRHTEVVREEKIRFLKN